MSINMRIHTTHESAATQFVEADGVRFAFRLSQAALFRSRFLRLAAGALLPFVVSCLSAAADPNPALAQNGGTPGTRDAPAPGRMGTILVSQFGPIKIHSYLSPADGLLVSTQIADNRGADGGRYLRRSALAAVCRRSCVIRGDARQTRRSHHYLTCAYRSLGWPSASDRAFPKRPRLRPGWCCRSGACQRPREAR